MDITIISSKLFPLADNFSQPDAVRLWGIGEMLGKFKFEVSYLFPETINFPSVSGLKKEVFFYNESNLNKMIREIGPRCVIINEWELAEKINGKQLPVIFDLSAMDLVDINYPGDISTQIRKIKAIRNCDLFICSTENQKWFFLSLLAQSGFEISGDLIHVVPPVFADKNFICKENMEITETKLVTYFDASIAVDFKSVEQIIGALSCAGNNFLEFVIGSDSFQTGLDNYILLSENLDKLSDGISFTEIFSWYEMIREFRSASIGVSLYEDTLFSRLRFPMDGVLYLCCGLPIICSRYNELGKFVEKYKAGWTVDTNNPLKIRKLVNKILACPQEIKRRSKNAAVLSSALFFNHKNLKPLVSFCKAPYKRESNNSGLVGYLMEYSNKVLNMNNPLLNDIYIEDILIFHSTSWRHLMQCLESIDIMFPMSNITIITPKHYMIEDIDLISDCNLIVCNCEEFESDSIKDMLILSDNYKFDLAVALLDNHYGEDHPALKSALMECGAKYKAGFTSDQNFVIIEDSIEKCIVEVLRDVDELPLNDSMKSTGGK